MSNCYTTFYFELPLPNPAVVEEVETLLMLGDDFHSLEGEKAAEAQKLLEEHFELFGEYEELGFDWEVQSHGLGDEMKINLVISADEAGNTSHAGDLIEWLLPKLDIKAAGFTYACYGDGANDGGAMAFVKTAEGVKGEFLNSDQWLMEKLK